MIGKAVLVQNARGCLQLAAIHRMHSDGCADLRAFIADDCGKLSAVELNRVSPGSGIGQWILAPFQGQQGPPAPPEPLQAVQLDFEQDIGDSAKRTEACVDRVVDRVDRVIDRVDQPPIIVIITD